LLKTWAQRVPREKRSKFRLDTIRRRVRWDAAEKSDESEDSKNKNRFLIYNHPTVTVDSASSL
jgi:hypothetical protein